MISWDMLKSKINENGLLENFDWNICKNIYDIDIESMPAEKIVGIVYDYISFRIDAENRNLVIKNILALDDFSKTVLCAQQYHLVQIIDGFFAIFTGYYSGIIYEMLSALEVIGAKKNWKLLDDIIKEININNRNKIDFLDDINNERLEHLYDNEEFDIILEKYNKEQNDLFWDDVENIENKICEYIRSEYRKKRNG